MVDTSQRIDKWLWCARFARTRTTAQKLAVSGRVRINRQKNDSAAHLVRVGDVLTIALDSGVRVVRIIATATRRGPAPEARRLYEDLSPPAAVPAPPPSSGDGRPTKRDRRALDRLRQWNLSTDDDFPSARSRLPK